MKNRLHIRALAEKIHIHRRLTGGLNNSLYGLPSEVDENHIFSVYISLIVLGRSDKNNIVLQLPGKVATMPGHILMSSQVMAHADKCVNFVGMFFQVTHATKTQSTYTPSR